MHGAMSFLSAPPERRDRLGVRGMTHVLPVGFAGTPGGARRARGSRAAALTALGATTLPISSSPVTTLRVSLETSPRISALRTPPSRNTAATTPPRVPLPPKMDTPPSSTAATTANSRPVPLSARALANRRV